MAPFAHWCPPAWYEESYRDRWLGVCAELSLHKKSVERLFPQFRTVLDTSWGCAWRGTLQPVAQPYEVLVTYFPGLLTSQLSYLYQPPRVYLLSPAPERRPSQPNIRIPHLYRHPTPEQPAQLCLYYPSSGEWKWWDWIGETIIPWTAEWLAFYEIWRITGTWEGPERHPDLGAIKTDQTVKPTLSGGLPSADWWLRGRPLLGPLRYALCRDDAWGPPVQWTADAVVDLEHQAGSILNLATVRRHAPSGALSRVMTHV